MIFAWTRGRAGFGFGPYADTTGSFGTHQIWLGGGATIAGYFGVLRVALSGGVDVDYLHAEPSASPVDVRPALGPLPTTIIVAFQLDVVGALTVGALSLR